MAGKQPFWQVTISTRVFIQVFLVIVFSRTVIFQLSDFDLDRLVEMLLQIAQHGFCNLGFLRIGDINPCPVIDPNIVSLPIQRSWIDCCKISRQNLVQVNGIWILNLYRFRMPATCSLLFIAGLACLPVDIPSFCFQSFKLVKKFLESPETASG